MRYPNNFLILKGLELRQSYLAVILLEFLKDQLMMSYQTTYLIGRLK